MSGIYIPWMSMPETCDDCQVSADCPNDEHIDGYKMQERPRFCQLYPVPPHGRSIDADALMERFSYSPGDTAEDRIWIRAARRIIIEAPTIIPRSEGKEYERK